MSTHNSTHTPFSWIICIYKIECVWTEVMSCADVSKAKYSKNFLKHLSNADGVKMKKTLRKSASLLEGRNDPSL
jgi:hypothetical protein